ncbi:MAG TPA: hypothetical protein VLS89_09775 [Candidatus Nanopelagicales bacterium]|nr:hypothetical protein [Candidatus Nanopelagicales bacterium]
MPEKNSAAQTNRTPGANEGPKPVRYVEHYLDDAYHRGFDTGPEKASEEGAEGAEGAEGEPDAHDAHDAKAAPQALTEPSEEGRGAAQ